GRRHPRERCGGGPYRGWLYRLRRRRVARSTLAGEDHEGTFESRPRGRTRTTADGRGNGRRKRCGRRRRGCGRRGRRRTETPPAVGQSRELLGRVGRTGQSKWPTARTKSSLESVSIPKRACSRDDKPQC